MMCNVATLHSISQHHQIEISSLFEAALIFNYGNLILKSLTTHSGESSEIETKKVKKYQKILSVEKRVSFILWLKDDVEVHSCFC